LDAHIGLAAKFVLYLKPKVQGEKVEDEREQHNRKRKEKEKISRG
jgi:hypothetical protein